MRKIAVWGLRYSDYSRSRGLFALHNNNEIEIVCELAYAPEDDEIFYKRRDISKSFCDDFDTIVVCDDGGIESAKKYLEENGRANAIDIISYDELLPPHYELILDRQYRIIEDILSADDTLVHDKNWLRQKIYDYGIYPFFKLAKVPEDGITFSIYGILQVPSEFVDFCHFISDKRYDTAVEVGVAMGRSSFIIAALLYRNNKELTYDMIDIVDNIRDFDRFAQLIPALRKQIPNTSNDFSGKAYDFCFIDGDHSYDGVMADWNNLGKHAKKMTVFHDIYGHEYDEYGGGTVKAWQDIASATSDSEHIVFSKYPDKWMGIGIIAR